MITGVKKPDTSRFACRAPLLPALCCSGSQLGNSLPFCNSHRCLGFSPTFLHTVTWISERGGSAFNQHGILEDLLRGEAVFKVMFAIKWAWWCKTCMWPSCRENKHLREKATSIQGVCSMILIWFFVWLSLRTDSADFWCSLFTWA